MLAEAGSALSSQDYEGLTPLHLAVNMGQQENAEILLRFGADPNACNKKNCTPLHLVRTPKMVHLLLTRGARPETAPTSKEAWYSRCDDDDEDNDDAFPLLPHFDTLLSKHPPLANELLNHMLSTNGEPLESPELLFVYDLRLFQQDDGSILRPEMALHDQLSFRTTRHLVKNPLMETFLQMKWDLVIFWLYISVIFVALNLFSILFTLFTLQGMMRIFREDILENDVVSNGTYIGLSVTEIIGRDDAIDGVLFWISYGVAAFFSFILSLKEIFQLCFSRSTYSKANFLDLLMVSGMLSYYGLIFVDVDVATDAGSVAFFGAFIKLVALQGQLPIFGIPIYSALHVFGPLLIIFWLSIQARLATNLNKEPLCKRLTHFAGSTRVHRDLLSDFALRRGVQASGLRLREDVGHDDGRVRLGGPLHRDGIVQSLLLLTKRLFCSLCHFGHDSHFEFDHRFDPQSNGADLPRGRRHHFGASNLARQDG